MYWTRALYTLKRLRHVCGTHKHLEVSVLVVSLTIKKTLGVFGVHELMGLLCYVLERYVLCIAI